MTTARATHVPDITLADGTIMPQLGYGVWQVEEDVAARSVQWAIEAGYRSIDTAMIYRNEDAVGAGIRASGVDRNQLFVTTKLWNTDHEHDDALAACDTSLRKLGLDHVDLYLMHWPAPATGNFLEAWRAMVELQQRGKARSIGVCNFPIDHLSRLLDASPVAPVINQIELHPYFPQTELRAFCADHDIQVEAWSPLGQGGELLDDPVIARIAATHARTPAQIVLRWHMQSGLVTIPKSVTHSRIIENISIFDFELTPDDMRAISELDRGAAGRIGPDPATATF